MKASSMRLEAEVEINREELNRLKNNSLFGKLRFYDDEPEPIKRDIDFEIRRSQIQKDFLVVSKEPKENYFGYAKRIIFSINGEFYEMLESNGSFGDRFYGGAGKLIIKVK